MTSYRKAAVRGFGSLAAFQVASVAVSQVSIILLATLLAPADFGLYGLAMIAIAMVSIPGDLGLTVELVRRADFEEALPTALRLRWLIAVGLTAAALAIAFVVAIVFRIPSVSALIAMLAGIFPAAALGFGPRVVLTRTLDFKVIAALDTVGRISGPVISVGFALAGAGYWSLGFGMLLSSWVTPVLLTKVRPVSYTGEFQRTTAASLISVGKFVSISTLFGFLVSTSDNLATVAGFGLLALGFYAFSYSLAVTIPRNIASMIETVVFPIFSRIAGDIERLKAAYLTTIRYVSYSVFPLAFAFLVFSDAFVNVILGGKWQPIVPVMRILAFAGLFYALSVPSSSALMALGLAGRVTKALAAAFLALAVGIVLALVSQLFELVAVAATIAAFVYFLSLQLNLSRRLNARYRELFAQFPLPAIASGLASVVPISILAVFQTHIVSLMLAAFGGLAAYVAVIELVSRGEFLRSVRELATLIGK